MTLVPTKEDLNGFRPIPFYFMTTTDPDEVSYSGAYDQLSKLKAAGFGGIVLFNKPPHGFDAAGYLSNAWFDMVKNFVHAAADLGLSVWINDGFNFPPGDAGGRISPEKYPHLAQKRIKLTDGEVKVEEVDWGFPAFEIPESAELFHQYVYEPTKAAVGEYFGTTVKGFFSDADNRHVSAGVFAKDSPQADYFPWCDDFEEGFAKKYGYDIIPYLPAILKKESIAQARDYWEYAGYLYQGWYRANKHWCAENGLEYTFHTSDSSPYPWADAPRCSAFTEGRALDMESIADYSGTDQELLELNGGRHMRQQEYWVPKATWGGDDAYICSPCYRDMRADLRVKQVQSASYFAENKGVMCEMFAASNWGANLTQLREIAARQIMQGVSFIVPHAYHHRTLGETKYFAPPDFSTRSHLTHGMRAFNDLLAQYCFLATRGKLQASVAVLDITDDIWTNSTASDALFDACVQLDRLPCGYVLADDKRILAKPEGFTVILNTGAPLSKARADRFAAIGLPVVESFEALAPYIGCDVSYQGEGTPHFMRRKLDDGRPLVLLCNLEQDKAIRGVLTVGGNAYPTYIHPGEIAFFTEEGPIPTDPTAEYAETGVWLDETVPVTWENENRIPIEWWQGAALKTDDVPLLTLPYSVAEGGTGAVSLLVSERDAALLTGVAADGKEITASGETVILSDRYIVWDLPESALAKGNHILTVKKSAPLFAEDPLYLRGEFGVAIQAEEDFYRVNGSQYSLARYIPKNAEITLTKRADVLNTAQSFTEQGHPFYSGGVTYRFTVTLPEDFGEAVLVMDAVRDIVSVSVDGVYRGQRIHAPFDLALGDMSGTHALEITVYNTYGNILEYYRAPSGLLGKARICKAK